MKEKIIDYISKEEVPLIWYCFILLIFFIPWMSDFSLTVDDEITAVCDSFEFWIARDRWVLAFLGLLFPQTTIPYFMEFLFCISLLISFFIFSEIYKLKDSVFDRILPFFLFVSSPIWLFLLDFYENILGLSTGLIFAPLSLLLFLKIYETNLVLKKILLSTFSILSLTIATGGYQTLIFIYPVLFIGYLLHNLILPKGEDNFDLLALARIIFFSVIVFVFAFCSHFIFSWFLQYLFEVPAGSYRENFINLDNIFGTFSNRISVMFSNLKSILLGSSKIYSFNARAYPIYFSFFGLCFGYILIKKGNTFKVKSSYFLWIFSVFLTLSSLLFIPFLMHFVKNGFMPYRSMVPIIFLYPIAFTLIGKFLNNNSKTVLTGLVGFITLSNLYALCNLEAAQRIALDFDKNLAHSIMSRIYALRPESAKETVFIETFGSRNLKNIYELPSYTTIGHSFFAWDSGNSRRHVAFMRLLGHKVAPMAVEVRSIYLKRFDKMNIWPEEGSVKQVEKNMFLIKLSKNPGPEYESLLLDWGDPATYCPKFFNGPLK